MHQLYDVKKRKDALKHGINIYKKKKSALFRFIIKLGTVQITFEGPRFITLLHTSMFKLLY